MAEKMNLNFNFNLSFDKVNIMKSYPEYCAGVGYPAPFQKQIEMYDFAFQYRNKTPRLILGARGYGKTDYITINGSGFELLKNKQLKILLITKENERGKEIVAEIREGLSRQGVKFANRAKKKIRLKGCRGKEDNFTALTIRSRGLRGRHPDLIIMEDPITPEDTSETERRRVKKVYEELLKLSKNIVIIGQPVHAEDLYQELRNVIPTLEVWYGAIPELDADLAVERSAGVSEASIQASYFGVIIDDNSLPFRNIERVDYYAKNNVMFIDPSHKGGDLTAIAIGGFIGDVLPVVGFAFKKAWYDCLEELDAILGQFNVGRICIETNGLGELPIMQLRSAGLSGVMGKNHTGNKHSRIMNCASFVESLKLTQYSGASAILKSANDLFIERVRKYEYNIKQDDPPDAMAGLCGMIGIIKDD